MSSKKSSLEKSLLANPTWRLNNLYYIKDPQGNRVKFNLNWAQESLWNNLHTFNVVLKARQLGMTTFTCLMLLDKVLWGENIQAGIVAHTLDDAQNIFQDKLKYAFDHLHPELRAHFKPVGDSSKELSFAHGSLIRVGTSLRSSTLQYLHISEFGKICAKYPDRAREIVTGSLNTVHSGQSIIIESTAEGKEGYFYEMCEKARKHSGALSPLDFRFHFFPWHLHPEYTIGVCVPIPDVLSEYFDKLELDGIKLSDPQKWWYVKKWETQREDMTREYPSTPDEAFSASQEGFWYASEMKALREAGHITNVSYDRSLPVHTAWDLGQADHMAIWFFQVTGAGEINLIDYIQKKDMRIELVASLLSSKGYHYGTHIWPHDANARDRAGITFVQQASALGIKGMVLEPHSFRDGINVVRTTLSRCWFDITKCKEGIAALEAYQKKWSSMIGGWTYEPLHNDHSHGADAFRYLCAGIKRIQKSSGSLETDYRALRNYWG